jgi:UDP-N-acetylmuramoyl-L-alanyl-D-glutamate--2,6-diaminopimelate ligase
LKTARLADLLQGVEVVSTTPGATDTLVTGVTHDSRSVEPGALFCCQPGETGDGHLHAAEAVRLGAAALLVERMLPLPIPQVVVRGMRPALAQVAATFWGHPSRRLRLVGVTGTNGKTTTTCLVRSILEHHGWPTGVIGTLSGPLTTPSPPDLQRRLAEMVRKGCRAAAMEVSSHGLDQHRVDATRFAVGVFTNLDRDHLDYHGDMESYFAAKTRLFEPDRVEIGVVNRDDVWGARLLRRGRANLISYSLDDVDDLQRQPAGSSFKWLGHAIRLPIPGRFNVCNALAAAATAACLGVPEETIAAGLSTASAPPGRMETIQAGQRFRIVVDCAHTPSALGQVLEDLSGEGGRLIVVFGCGGDRDRTKRPEMGALVARYADSGILTADNPRSEPLGQIFGAVLRGAGTDALLVEPDRQTAIYTAIEMATAYDTVLIAGKGDQTVQQIGTAAIPFDDRQMARDAVKSLTELAHVG